MAGARTLIKREQFTLLDPDPSRREAIRAFLALHADAVITHANLDSLLSNWPATGTIVLVDCDALVAAVQGAMRTTHSWRSHIVFGEVLDASAVVDAVIGGAADYIAWPCASDQFADRLERCVSRSEQLYRQMTARQQALRRLAKLTKRELEVVMMASQGMTSVEIATALGIAIKTADIHRYRAMRKLEVDRFAKAVRIVVEAESA